MQVIRKTLTNKIITDFKTAIMNNDFEIVKREKNNYFIRRFRLNKSKIRHILLNLNETDFNKIDEELNSDLYGNGQIIIFLTNKKLTNFHGYDENVKVYIKVKLNENEIVPLISFHEAEF